MTKKQKMTLVRIILSGVLLVTAYLLPLEHWWKLAAFLVPYLLIGWDVLWKAVRNIAHGQIFDENFLMSIATIGAFVLGEYPEGVFVMLFYQVGELFQSYAVGKSRRSITQLMDICPDYANVRRDGELVQVEPDEVHIDDVIIVKPGEKIPLDGIVTSGTSSLNTAALTGESLPRTVCQGDEVISGCVNMEGLLEIKVTKEFGQSTVSKILELVENSSAKKARTENFITKFAKYYTPCVVLGAVLLAILPPLLLGLSWSEWIERALIFLVISCPCALVISVPLSFFGGIGGASRQGVLVKGGNYLEALSKAETVVFDKTGTLTKGVFDVTAIYPVNCDEKELIEYAALAESYSDHPIARSVKDAYGKPIPQERISDVKELAGRGVSALIDGKQVFAGNDKLMKEAGVEYREETNGTAVHVAVDGKYMGHLLISDRIKEDSAKAIQDLKSAGIKNTVMLTGDEKAAGEAVANALKLDKVYTKLLPAEKVERVETLLAEKSGGTLVFVGDGINDAPVLSRADVGIAMGAMGSDAAIEAADIVLMDDKPSKIAAALKISRKTMRIVWQNIIFALAVKLAVMVLGALGVANMWEAVFADVGVCVLAVLNSMRTMSTK